MTQVAEVKQKWREATRLIDDARVPWDKNRDLSSQSSSLGLDIETSKQALLWVLDDIQRLQRQ